MIAQSSHAPLTRFVKVDTRSPDEAREQIGRIFCPHFLNPAQARPASFHARHHTARQAGYSMNFVAYGATVEIDPGQLQDFFLLQVPLRGGAHVRCGTLATEAQAGRTASILSPTLPTRMTWHEGCEKLIVLIDRKTVEAQYAALAGRTNDAIEFHTAVDLDGGLGPLLDQHLGLMLAAAEKSAPVPEAYLVSLREGLIALLLNNLDHSGRAPFADATAPPAPAAIRRAEAFIAENAGRSLTMAEVAAAAGTSLRALQEGFRRYRQATLTQTVLDARLVHFREALSDPRRDATVAELAFAAGLGHLGRAAQAYRARYGETPSQTRKRCVWATRS
ncbi:MAG: AraC family transcriptional regulator [Pseudolabrys sp.]